MWKRNDGSDPVNAVQNRFTAYLAQVVKFQKGLYIKKHDRQDSIEKHIDPMEHAYLWPEEVDMPAGLPPLAQMENQRLLRALLGLTEREWYIPLTHVPDDDVITLTRLLLAVKGHPYEAVFVVTLFTGLRKGEVPGLTWDCVDLERVTLLVNKQLSHYKNASGLWGYGMDSSKNSRSRKLTLLPFAVDVLRHQKTRQAK